MIYLISDTHFGHQNAIAYCNRPFETALEMDTAMMKNWNSVVTDDDLVIHLGDFMFGKKKNCSAILERLKGKKWLVSGNHDPKEVCTAFGWDQTTKSLEFQYEDYSFHVKHWPWGPEEPTIKENVIYCHGHSHNSTPKIHRNQINMGVEHWNYTPVSIEQIIKEWEQHIGSN